jgi:hypothetical protein
MKSQVASQEKNLKLGLFRAKIWELICHDHLSPVVTICTSCCNIKEVCISPYSLLLCSTPRSQLTPIIFLDSSNRPVFIVETKFFTLSGRNWLYIPFRLRRVFARKSVSLRIVLKNETRLLEGAWVLVGRKKIIFSMFRLTSFSNYLIISENKYK